MPTSYSEAVQVAVHNIKWSGFKKCLPPVHPSDPIIFKPFAKCVTLLQGGHFRKLDYCGSGWNFGLQSEIEFDRDDKITGVSFQVADASKAMRVCLAPEGFDVDNTGSFNTPNAFCVDLGDGYLRGKWFTGVGDFNAWTEVSGKETFGQVYDHDTVAMVVNKLGLLEIIVNRVVRWVQYDIFESLSMLGNGDVGSADTLLFRVLVSLHDVEGEIYNVRWMAPRLESTVRGEHRNSSATAPVFLHEIEAVDWQKSEGRLRTNPTQKNAWVSGGVSADSLPEGQHVNGVLLLPRFNDRMLVAGLCSSGTWLGLTQCEFVALLSREAHFVVVEKGVFMGQFGTFQPGSKIEVVVNKYGFVEYKVDGQIRYVSKQQAVFPLSVKTFFHDVEAEAQVVWSGCVNHLRYDGLWALRDTTYFCSSDTSEFLAEELIRFSFFDGVVHPPGFQGGSLQKMDGISPSRPGGAISEFEIKELDMDDIWGVSFQPLQSTAFVMIGLANKNQVMHNFGSPMGPGLHPGFTGNQLEFGVALGRNGDLDIYEDGKLIRAGVGSYQAHDVVAINWDPDENYQCYFTVNDQILHKFSRPVQNWPYVVAAIINDPEARLYNIKWKGFYTAPASAAGVPVRMNELNGVALKEIQSITSTLTGLAQRALGGIQKHVDTLDSNLFNWAVSADSIKAGDSSISGFEFQLASPKHVKLGLHGSDSRTQDLDFSVELLPDGTLLAHDGSTEINLGNFDSARPVSLVFADGVIEFRVGCSLAHTSSPAQLPLWVHVQLFEEEAQVDSLSWVSPDMCPDRIEWGRPMSFDYFNGVGPMGGGEVRKLEMQKTSWNTNFVAHNAISHHDATLVEGVELVAPSLDTQAIVGLSHIDSFHDNDKPFWTLDHSMFFGANGTDTAGSVSIWEGGSLVGDYGKYQPGDKVQILVNRDNIVEYRVGDQIRYTSHQTPVYPVKFDAFIMNPQGHLEDLKWVASQSIPPGFDPEVDEKILFQKFHGIVAPSTGSRGELTKILSTGGWNAGAISEKTISNSPNGPNGFSYTVADSESHFMMGFTTGPDPQMTYRGFAVGVLCLRTGEIQVFESGDWKKDLGDYNAGHVIAMKLTSQTVEVYVNGASVYNTTAANPISGPLHVDAAFFDSGSKASDISWVSL